MKGKVFAASLLNCPMTQLPETTATAPDATPEKAPASPASQRLVSLDAFRGLIMLMMASAAFGLSGIAKEFPDSTILRHLGWHCDHAKWLGCSLWDLIQPSFMFMVGVALAYSAAKRRAEGQKFGWMFLHAVWRGVMLVLLAVFLTSSGSTVRQTEWQFTNVLAQIGLGYPLLFLLAFTSPRVQWITAGAILVLYWAAFAFYPLPPADFNWASVGVPANWPHLQGFAAHWERGANFAADFDQWFLNLFPRKERFYFNNGYQTLNFVPSLATMIFGLLAGGLLRSELPLRAKIQRLLVAGVAGLAIGELLNLTGVCPMVKHLWTPSFALFSGGWVALFLAFFVTVIELYGARSWAFPLVVAGMNPITLYVLWQLMGGFIKDSVRRHFGQHIFESFGPLYVQTLERATVLLVLWLILYWMYRRKIVVRI
jgi:predicted acyltransferase